MYHEMQNRSLRLEGSVQKKNTCFAVMYGKRVVSQECTIAGQARESVPYSSTFELTCRRSNALTKHDFE